LTALIICQGSATPTVTLMSFSAQGDVQSTQSLNSKYLVVGRSKAAQLRISPEGNLVLITRVDAGTPYFMLEVFDAAGHPLGSSDLDDVGGTSDLAFPPGGGLLLASQNGIVRFDATGENPTEVALPPMDKSWESPSVSATTIASNGDVVVAGTAQDSLDWPPHELAFIGRLSSSASGLTWDWVNEATANWGMPIFTQLVFESDAADSDVIATGSLYNDDRYATNAYSATGDVAWSLPK
jgi:hypothetical protein